MVAYTNYPSDARVRREAETLSREAHFHVRFLSLKKSESPKVYHLNGVTVQELNISKYQGKGKKNYILSYLKFLKAASKELNRLLRAGNLDIVHVHNMPNFMIFSAIIPRIFGKKLVLDIHDSIPETYVSKFGEKKTQRLLFKLLAAEESLCCYLAHKVICVNQVQKHTLVDRGLKSKKALISLNVPDPEIFSPSHRGKTPYHPDNGFKLVYHGTITRRLGIDLAVRAVSLLKGKIPGLQFHVMGKGDDLESFADLSKSLNVENEIHFNCKMVPIENLPEMLSAMNVGIIANRKDPATELMLPVKMLEYMSLGIPVVAPRLKAIQHYFDENSIQYFEPENVGSLAESIYALYQDEELRRTHVKSAYEFLDEHGWESHKLDFINMYRELLNLNR